MPVPVLRLAVAVVLDGAGRWLLVRKRGTSVFLQPGGKVDPRETPAGALVRELREELGLVVDPGDLTLVGDVEAPAAHEPGHTVRATAYRVALSGRPLAAAEIEEAAWVDPRSPGVPLAPLTRALMEAAEPSGY